MLEAMTLLNAAWECVSPTALVNYFRKASISSESQARSQFDDDDPFKLLAAPIEEFQGKCKPPLNFTVNGSVDADKDVITSEVHFLADSESSLELLNRSLMQQQNNNLIRSNICAKTPDVFPFSI